MSFKKILCPVDFSEPSRRAMRVAAGMAKDAGGALTLCHAFQMPIAMYGFPAFNVSVVPPRAEIVYAVNHSLGDWRREAHAAGAPAVDLSSIEGVAWHAIVDLAKSGGYDLIVIGSQGLSGLQRALVGSVAEKVARHAPCPVLVVRGVES